MQRWNLVAPVLLLSLSLPRPAPAGAQATDGKPDAGANAAMKYWQAFALLPPLDKDQETLLQEWNRVPLDARARELIDKSQGSRDYLQRGARLQRCDWSLDYEDGIRLRLPFLPKAVVLARLTALHARHEFAQGRKEAGWDDVTALLKLGRHVEMGPTFIQNLVGYAIQTTAIEAAAPYLSDLKPILPPDAPALLNALPAGPTLPQVVLMEKQLGALWMVRVLKEAEERREGAWQGTWKELCDAMIMGNEGEESRNRGIVPPVKTFAQAVQMLEDLLPLYDELARLSALPWNEFDARYPAFVAQVKAAGPLARFVLPNMDQIVPAARRNQVRVALFQAALAVVQEGSEALRRFQDPSGGGPFAYRALDKGFELKSKLLHHGKPVTLAVGQE
jgi:hypothetical protein